MKYIILVLALVSFNAFAISNQDLTGFSQLTDVQKAEIAKQIAQTAAQNAKPEVVVPDPEDFEKYAKIGEGIAKSLGAAMKELNVQSNEFLSTPVGMITTGLIIYKVLGDDVLGQIHAVIESFMFTTIWISFLIWYVRRSCDYRVVYDETKTTWYGSPKIKEVYREGLSNDRSWAIVSISFICLAISVILL